MSYQIKTNATIGGQAIWSKPNGVYGNAKCVNWRDHGQLFTTIRWVA